MDTSVTSREELAAVMRDAAEDFRRDPERWENNRVDLYLEAMAGWLRDSDGYYANRGEPSPGPSWQLFADAVRAGLVYE